MTRVIKVIKSDKLYDINFTCQDSDGNAFNLTGYSQLLLKVQKQNETALKFSGAMTVVSAVAGTCKYTVQSGDLDEIGNFYAEIQVTFEDGKVVTFGDIIIIVEPELPR